MNMTIQEIVFYTPDSYAIEIQPGSDILLATPQDDSFLGWKHLPKEAQSELNDICKAWQNQLNRCVELVRQHKDTTSKDREEFQYVGY